MKTFSQFILETENPNALKVDPERMKELSKEYNPSPEERERRKREQLEDSKQKAERTRQAWKNAVDSLLRGEPEQRRPGIDYAPLRSRPR